MTRARDTAGIIGSNTLTIDGSSRIGIGSTTPSSKFEISGNTRTTGIVTSFGFSGNITGTAATFTTVNVSGVLTFEDVTNVDSLGIITARNGIQVTGGGGINLTGGAGIITTTTAIVGSAVTINATGVNVTGLVTAREYDITGSSNTLNATGLSVGIGTFTTVSATNDTGTNINKTGVGTITTLNTTNLVPTNINSSGITTTTDVRISSVAERLTIQGGNTVTVSYGSSTNVVYASSASGNITVNVNGIPTVSSFDNSVLSVSVAVRNTGTARSCTAINLNGVSRTIHWAGGSLTNALSGVSTSNGYDIYSFTGINTVGSASTTTNYVVLGVVNGGYR
jgi:hypothetical protein